MAALALPIKLTIRCDLAPDKVITVEVLPTDGVKELGAKLTLAVEHFILVPENEHVSIKQTE